MASMSEGNWGDWIWSEDYRRYYRQRQDDDGIVETCWAPDAVAQDENPVYEADDGTPSLYPLYAGYSGTDDGPSHPFIATADRTEDDYDKKRRNDNSRRQRNQRKFRHPEDAKRLAEDSDPDISDGGYKIEPSHKFQPGKIFKTLWAGPSEQVHGVIAVPSGFRTLIVVATDEGHSTCVSILTPQENPKYKRRAESKNQGVIYSEKLSRKRLDGDAKPGFRPVRAILKAEGQTIDKDSRVDYSKLLTVEHNVKVFFIGSIAAENFEIVQDAVNDCWDRKVRHR